LAKINFREKLFSISYRLFHDKLPYYRNLHFALLKTGISESYESYISITFFTAIILGIIAFPISLLLHSYFLKIPYLIAVLPSSIITVLVILLSFAYSISYPLILKRIRENEIDSRLPSIIGYASVISASTTDLVEIFKILETVEKSKAAKSVYRIFLKYVIAGGKSIYEALLETSKRCPSDRLGRILEILASVYISTGNIREYLEKEAMELNNLKFSNLRRLISSLTNLSEIYVGLIVIGPLILIIITSALTSFQGGGLISPELLAFLITFIATPLLAIVYLAIVISIIGREE